MNQRDSFNTRLADEQADNVRLRAEVERLTEQVKQEKVNGRRMAERALSNTPQGRAWLAEVDQLRGELAAVRRERDDVKEALHATVSNTESMTYGELPNSLQELIHPHEFDNMTISEQRAWSIGRFADVTQELDETLEAATQQYEEELAACRNPDHKMTLLESIKWLVAERNLALARNAALEEAGDAMANSADCVGLHNRNEVKHWRQVRGERP